MSLDFRKVFIANRVYTRFMKRYPTTIVDADLWDRFVDEIGRRRGMRKGVIRESLEEAIALWIDRGENSERGDP